MTIWELVAAALAAIGIPVAANQMMSATGSDLPDQFAVYQVISDPPAQHADDAEVSRNYHVQVSGYSRTGLAELPDIEAAMLAAGFTRAPGRELPYNLLTRHYGFAYEFWKHEE